MFLFCACASVQAQSRWQSCLPSDVKADETAAGSQAAIIHPGAQVRIGQRLDQVRARCRRGKLVDGRGRQISFYRLAGCWGNPPADYLEIMQNQRSELKRLKRRYTIVEISCGPSDVRVQ
jgi:hypothetical protein